MSKTIVDEAKKLNANRVNFDRVNATRKLLNRLNTAKDLVISLEQSVKEVKNGNYAYIDYAPSLISEPRTIEQCNKLTHELLKLAESSTLGLKPKR